MLAVSLLWSTVVGLVGFEDKRPWGSFFMQYLWEFGLGMWIAQKIYQDKAGKALFMDIHYYRWWWLLLGTFGGMSLSALMAWNGGFLKLYNDIPSLVGYLSVALLIYKIGIGIINRFFEWTNSFSYELYLVHSLVFVIMTALLTSLVPASIILTISLVAAYIAAYAFNRILKKTRLVK